MKDINIPTLPVDVLLETSTEGNANPNNGARQSFLTLWIIIPDQSTVQDNVSPKLNVMKWQIGDSFEYNYFSKWNEMLMPFLLILVKR